MKWGEKKTSQESMPTESERISAEITESQPAQGHSQLLYQALDRLPLLGTATAMSSSSSSNERFLLLLPPFEEEDVVRRV